MWLQSIGHRNLKLSNTFAVIDKPKKNSSFKDLPHMVHIRVVPLYKLYQLDTGGHTQKTMPLQGVNPKPSEPIKK